MAVKAALEAAGVEVKGAELVDAPAHAGRGRPSRPRKKVMRLVDRLEESDDIQDVYHNMELTDEIAGAARGLRRARPLRDVSALGVAACRTLRLH